MSKIAKLNLRKVNLIGIVLGVLLILLIYRDFRKSNKVDSNAIKENAIQNKEDEIKIKSTTSTKSLTLSSTSTAKSQKAKQYSNIVDDIWNYVYDKKYICSNMEYMGSKIKNNVVQDGAYYICKDKAMWPFPNEKGDRCLVYSFGIANDFKFDDAMSLSGCEVHAFDPSTHMEDQTTTKTGVKFHKIGISNKDNDKGFKGWKMRTLKTLIKELGHENRVLDYLKVDTDKGDSTGFEFEVMQQLLDTGLYKCVRQYAMEIHLPGPLSHPRFTKLAKDLYSSMTSLERKGFRLYQNVDNVRYIQSLNPRMNQLSVKKSQFAGKSEVVLWEAHFVNVNLKGTCGS